MSLSKPNQQDRRPEEPNGSKSRREVCTHQRQEDIINLVEGLYQKQREELINRQRDPPTCSPGFLPLKSDAIKLASELLQISESSVRHWSKHVDHCEETHSRRLGKGDDRHPPLIINLGDDNDDNEDESNSSDDAEVLATPLDDTFPFPPTSLESPHQFQHDYLRPHRLGIPEPIKPQLHRRTVQLKESLPHHPLRGVSIDKRKRKSRETCNDWFHSICLGWDDEARETQGLAFNYDICTKKHTCKIKKNKTS
uniref:Uncharacterized protein n=1 Tax=Timema shepardi TaxID=629360 RepID=A0A7R9G508_TIMSH|nr:unnamed protein product [Timema shepardi]